MRLELEMDNPQGVWVWNWTIWAEVELPVGLVVPLSFQSDNMIEFPLRSGTFDRLPDEYLDDALYRIIMNPHLLYQAQ